MLGPILFCLFTTPIYDIFHRHGVNAHFYADDTQFWVSFNHKDAKAEAEARFKINQVFGEISRWMTSHHLKLNASKTVFLPISRHLSFDTIPSLDLQGVSIKPSRTARNLGFIYDFRFSWNHRSRS